MAWSVSVGTVAETTATGGNLTLSEPASSQSGDLLVACIAYRSNAAFTVPSGWTLIAQESSGDTNSNAGIASGIMAYIVRGSSAPDLTFTRTGGNVARGAIVRYRDSGGGSITMEDSNSVTLASNNATITLGGISGSSGSLIVAMAAGGDGVSGLFSAMDAATDPTTASGATDTTTAPTSGTWIERLDSQTVTGADTTIGIFDGVKSSASTTGNLTLSQSTSMRSVMIAATFAASASGYTLTADGGSFTFTGASVGLKAGRKIAANAGAFTLTGASVSLRRGYLLTASGGSFTFTGANVGLSVARRLAASAGGFTLNGASVGLKAGRRLSIEAGSFSLSGADVALQAARRLAAGSGAFALTGADVTLTYTPNPGSYTLVAGGGSFVLSGAAVGLKAGRRLVAESAAYTVAGGSVLFTYSGWTAVPPENESWSAVAPVSETWTPASAGSASWGSVAANTGTWTPVSPTTETWQ